MKRRKGFVSNSSTSSFVCEACGVTEAGMDLTLEEACMFECEYGHVIHMDCSTHETEIEREWCRSEVYDKIPTKFCPVCSLEKISDCSLLKYLCKKFDTNKTEIVKEIQEKFEDKAGFFEFIK